MATQQLKMRTGVDATESGRALQDDLRQLRDLFASMEGHLEAMNSQKGTTDEYATIAASYGFVDTADTLDAATAQAAYNEMNSFVGNTGAALKQICGKLRQ